MKLSCKAQQAQQWYQLVSVHKPCSLHMISLLMFSQCVSDMKKRREEILCASAFVFQPEMMEINVGSLLWLHSTEV